MLQATGYPAEIADFYSAISAGYWGVFLVAKTVQLVMVCDVLRLLMSTRGEDGANLTKVLVSFKLNGLAWQVWDSYSSCHARNNF